MTRAHYYASTVRNLKDVANYAVYPAAKILSLLAFRNEFKASAVASAVTTAFYAGITTSFFGQEARMVEIVARDAVSAELGVNPEEVTFSDYWQSKNHLVQKECHDIDRLTKVRYLTDAIFLTPMAFSFASHAIPGMRGKSDHLGSTQGVKGHDIIRIEDVLGVSELGVALGYAGKAGYWWHETYDVQKTGFYEFVKWHELGVSLSKDIAYNDLLALYQRSRDDQKLPRLSIEEVLAVKPFFQWLAQKYNNSTNINASSLFYLIGNNLIRFHGPDGATISQTAIEESKQAVEHVDKVGLGGIREENRQKRLLLGLDNEQAKRPGPKTFVQRLGNFLLPHYRSKTGIASDEFISARDPTEFVYSGR